MPIHCYDEKIKLLWFMIIMLCSLRHKIHTNITENVAKNIRAVKYFVAVETPCTFAHSIILYDSDSFVSN